MSWRNLASILILLSGSAIDAWSLPPTGKPISPRGASLGDLPIVDVAPAANQTGRNAGDRDARVYRQHVRPHWVAGNNLFWYRNDLADGAREFVVVDALKGVRSPAFDHAAMAVALGESTDAARLPIDSLEYSAEGQLVAVRSNDNRLLWNADTGVLTKSDDAGPPEESIQSRDERPSRTGADTTITFINKLKDSVELFWLSGDGTKRSYGEVSAGARRDQHTFGGHRWRIVDADGVEVDEVIADDRPRDVVIDGKRRPRSERRSRRGRRNMDRGANSPDGNWVAAIEDHNVVVRLVESGQTRPLSTDGGDRQSYGQLTWAPDSQHLVAFRTFEVEKQPVHVIRSSPPQGGRAVLESHPYLLPGDPFPTHELNVFYIDSGQQLKPKVERFEHEWERPAVTFSPGGAHLRYGQTDRGHQRYRLIEVGLADGEVRNLIDEKSETFIWTAHTENPSTPRISWLEGADEVLYVTEKNGWRQLLLVNAASGQEVRELTPRGLVLRSIERIDHAQRRVLVALSGRAEQDPYFKHYALVDIDTAALIWLTEGDGNHSIEFSPDGRFLIDTYSRVDLPPVHELRSGEDGRLVCPFESADASELVASGWTSPEVFVAKGRDGVTDIWGIICRPRDFDPQKSYPVIEDIYAGPQGSFVPKSFSPAPYYEALTSQGFIVVKIDGMGTANRSKAFHDVCWKNLKDGGFEDRILWMKAAAKQHTELNLDRVGIYGVSAGGQNAAAAVLFHPEFYKVAVAACGCHDNRMDKASWNEQWMGYPVGPHYAESSNVENAHRLQGKLLLIVGEVDTNVPPESTMRVADALIRADKDFDLLVVPNAGHGMGGAYGERRMCDFFVRHLLGER
ncbi:prolyl oligopeptidase family serine peptidase [Botrimarina mediterranea]|uniref:Prolyl tripeptidyl peptidase n=1 Tax=Botrimarina mediterranea TaxID=2528022 RepID=A0A518KAV0_9BACT|nr:prolyl oligopeptidase family serine peptidase [Botrimarina mediterranea]QDV74923.1 Prolyl tripeptidyl peptidase precursor [Botrimarina mediterranea]QDV79568.1 Prolyl tripeptidyl peptidase precursor [Planctomycetes bacterium K2D]